MKFFFNKRSKDKAGNKDTMPADKVEIADKGESEIAAVIALAISMYVKRLREEENSIVTIQKVMKPYSPWSSKIYGMRRVPMYMPGPRRQSK